jgi:glyoxylase-like metal-dependent hydrolase (beta-lactamase superfamily II)
VLEWEDGRLLLVDVGMTRDGAAAFGGPIEMLSGGQPIEPLGSVVERLGNAADRVQGVVFTHMHVDHVGGIGDLCRALRHGLRVFMTQAQAEVVNYTTRPGHRLLDAAFCVERVTLPDGPSPLPIPGFAGVSVIAAGGHTPGSQIVVAQVGRDAPRPYTFVGDIVNNIDGIVHDVPKPRAYRWLVVPEDGPRQSELRKYLRLLRDEQGFTMLVSHDQLDLERGGIPTWERQQE